MPPIHRVDRLWPDPAAGLELDVALADFAPPAARPDRPAVAVNMVTSLDGRAQLGGTAEGLGGRADRRLMQLYRARFDAVASGAGTLVADDFYSRLAPDLAARRVAEGRTPHPLAVVVAGRRALPVDRTWFGYEEQRRVVAVGSQSPHAGDPSSLPGVETWVAPGAVPEPGWLLQRLAEEGIGSLLLEGGPTLNAAFLAAGALDELYWTVGPRLVAAEALPMIASLPGGTPHLPREGRLVSAHRSGDELFLRYRFGSIGP